MKTIALSEHTFELLKALKQRERLRSFELLVRQLMCQHNGVSHSLLGILKGKAKPFNSDDRKKIWRDRV